jgi:hypothetical protein
MGENGPKSKPARLRGGADNAQRACSPRPPVGMIGRTTRWARRKGASGMAKPKLQNWQETKDGAVFVFEGSDANAVADAVNMLLAGEGYSLESGTPLSGEYGKGSKVARALLGAFVKRYKFSVQINPQGDTTMLSFSRAMSGFSGGVIGMGKLKEEQRRLLGKIHATFSQ